MENIAVLFSHVIQIYQIEFTLYGFTFSLWQVFVFVIVASLICWILWEVFMGD